MPSNRSQDSQDSQTSSVTSHIHFTTAELKDSLRPSTVLPPNPSTVRGNAARLKSKNTKENSQQQHTLLPSTSPNNNNTTSTITTTLLGTLKSKVLPDKLRFIFSSSNSNNDNQKNKNKAIGDHSPISHFPFATQEWSGQSIPNNTREVSGVASQIDQSPIVSDSISASKSQKHINEEVEPFEEADFLESTIQPSLILPPSPSPPPQTPQPTHSSMSTTRSRRSKRIASPELTTFSQLVSGQRIPSVSQSTEERNSTQGIHSQIYHSDLMTPIIYSDDLTADPEFSPATTMTTTDTYESLVAESSNDINNPFIQSSDDTRADFTPQPSATDQRIARNRSRRIANSKGTGIIEHVIAVELPIPPKKTRAAMREATHGNKSRAISEIDNKTAAVDINEGRTGMQLRTRSGSRVNGVEDSPSKHTRSQGLSRNESPRRIPASPSLRASTRRSGRPRRISIKPFADEENDDYNPDSTDDNDSDINSEVDGARSGSGDQASIDESDVDEDDDSDDDSDDDVGTITTTRGSRGVRRVNSFRRLTRLAEINLPAKRPRPPSIRLSSSPPSISPPPIPPPQRADSNGNSGQKWGDVSNNESGIEDEIVPPKKKRWRGDLNLPPESPILPTIESGHPFLDISTSKKTTLESPKAPTKSQSKAVISQPSSSKTFDQATRHYVTRVSNSSRVSSAKPHSVVVGIDLKGQTSFRGANGDTVNKKLVDGELKGDPWNVEKLERLWIKNGIKWPLRDTSLEGSSSEPFKTEPYSVNFLFGTALPLPKETLNIS